MSEQTHRRQAPDEGFDRRQPMWWLILAALSSWSYMAVWAANADELAGFFPSHFGVWLLLFLTVGAVVQRASFALLRGSAGLSGSFAVAAVVVIFLQSWNSRLTDGFSLGPRLAVHAALTIVVVAIVLRLASAFPQVRAVFGVVTVFLVGVPYLTLAGQTWNWLTDANQSPLTPARIEPSAEAPDVFVVVLDEYTSGAVLQSEFGLDNSEFEADLQRSGVAVVPEAKSNYTSTRLSVAGLLDGSYPAVGGPADTSYADLVGIHSGNNVLFASLRQAGYETHLFDNAWTFTRCGRNVDVCHGGGLNELDWLVAGRTPFVDLIPWLQLSPWIRGSLEQFREATRLASEQVDRPRLVYLHALIPHAPLQLDSDCSVALPGLGTLDGVVDTPAARVAYASQVACVNKLAIDLLDATPSDSIVFVTGDHGVRWASEDLSAPGLTPAGAAGTLGVLTAYRFPERCPALPAGASLTRAAGDLFSCLGIESDVDRSYEASLPDRYFNQTLLSDGTYRITDVTAVVRGADG